MMLEWQNNCFVYFAKWRRKKQNGICVICPHLMVFWSSVAVEPFCFEDTRRAVSELFYRRNAEEAPNYISNKCFAESNELRIRT
jgi:hypothetical protein